MDETKKRHVIIYKCGSVIEVWSNLKKLCKARDLPYFTWTQVKELHKGHTHRGVTLRKHEIQ